jgi:hypothetical protein
MALGFRREVEVQKLPGASDFSPLVYRVQHVSENDAEKLEMILAEVNALLAQ